jgi:hypothetical protein
VKGKGKTKRGGKRKKKREGKREKKEKGKETQEPHPPIGSGNKAAGGPSRPQDIAEGGGAERGKGVSLRRAKRPTANFQNACFVFLCFEHEKTT